MVANPLRSLVGYGPDAPQTAAYALRHWNATPEQRAKILDRMMYLLEHGGSPAIQLAAVRTLVLMDALNLKREQCAQDRDASAAALQLEAFRTRMAADPAFGQWLASAALPAPTAVIPAAPPAAPPADDTGSPPPGRGRRDPRLMEPVADAADLAY